MTLFLEMERGLIFGQTAPAGSILNTVQGNFIGTDSSGTKALPNQRFGIIVTDSQNTIGGVGASQANVISGNLGGGILIYGTINTTANIVGNNLIGTDLTGTKPLPNKGDGIQIGLNGAFKKGLRQYYWLIASSEYSAELCSDNAERYIYVEELKKQSLSNDLTDRAERSVNTRLAGSI